MRQATLALAAAASVVVPPLARADQANPLILRAVGTQPGLIHLVVLGEPGSRADLAEIVAGRRRPLGSTSIAPNGSLVLNAARWSCARLIRRFVASNDAGELSYFSLRTPSCRQRVTVAAPRRAEIGERVSIQFSDAFELGLSRARVCALSPAAAARCARVRLPRSGRAIERSFRLGSRGRWRVAVRAPGLRVAREIAVGVAPHPRSPRVLLIGDSMMQSLDNVLTDRLAGRADVTSEVAIGSALSIPSFDFVATTARRVRNLRPAATVVFLGANDHFPLPGPSGAPAQCCGSDWVAAYAARLERLLRAGGRRTFIATLPAPRDPAYRRSFLAVNAGIRRATARVPSSRVIDLIPAFTPGFVYRDFLRVRSRDVYVRETDGIHISVDGLPIVARLMTKALERDGALARRGP